MREWWMKNHITKHLARMLLIAVIVLVSGKFAIVYLLEIGRDPVTGGYKETLCLFAVIKVACFILLTAMEVLYLLIFVRKAALHQIFLVAATALGMVYILVFPAGNAPDELRHFSRAYSLSDIMMGVKDKDDGNIMVRRADREFVLRNNLTEQGIDRDYVEAYYKGLFTTVSDTELSEASVTLWSRYERVADYKLQTPAYLPAAVGIAAGRLLRLSLPGLFVMGRGMNLLFFLICIAWGIRKLPVGKELLLVLSLLPMTLHQATAVSYDSMIISLAFLMTALTVKLAYEDGPVNKREAVLLFVAVLLLLPQKNFGLFTLALYPFLIFQRKGKRNRSVAVAGIAVLAAGILLGTVALILKRNVILHDIWLPHVIYNGQAGYNVSELLRSPRQILIVGYHMLLLSGQWLEEFLGGSLGSLNIHIHRSTLYPYLFLLFFAAQTREGEAVLLERRDKAFLLGVSLLTACMVIGSMFFLWTEKGLSYVAGIQGRYFIPMSLAALLTLRGKSFRMGEYGMQRIVFLAAFCHIFVLTSVFMQYL